jgi:hypothetical protein
MIYLTHMIFILNFIFTVVFYTVGGTKLDLIYMCLKKIN